MVPRPIPGTAFFPGGYGLWRVDVRQPLPPWPLRGVMVLGHDFHSQAGYRASMAQGHESSKQPTWRNLLALFREAEVGLSECFFTNAYMGLREKVGATGLFPGSRDPGFVERCRVFLAWQIDAQRPRLIVTLGRQAPRMLAALFPQLGLWQTAASFREIDRAGGLQLGIRIAANHTAAVVALIHPSFRHASIKARRFGAYRGHAAELAMLRNGLRAASVQGDQLVR